MRFKSLPPGLRDLLGKLNKTARKHGYVLAGGTGLALHLGHRVSVDLDFFTRKPFSTETVFRELKRLGLGLRVLEESEGSLTVTVDDIKVSMFRYPYPFLEETGEANGVPVAGVVDIAAMKVIAISQRGAKRDFYDLYYILQDVPFRKVAENMAKRFGDDRINPVNIGKGLVFFADADGEPDPELLGKNKPSWAKVKKFFIGNVRQMVLDMEGAKR